MPFKQQKNQNNEKYKKIFFAAPVQQHLKKKHNFAYINKQKNTKPNPVSYNGIFVKALSHFGYYQDLLYFYVNENYKENVFFYFFCKAGFP